MDDEKLILLVQSFENLYSKYHKDYKNVKKRNQAWSEIAQEMGYNAESCVRRWTSLRDRYTREKRLQETSNNRPYWPFMDFLEFLYPHIKPRPGRLSTYTKTPILPLKVEILSSNELPHYQGPILPDPSEMTKFPQDEISEACKNIQPSSPLEESIEELENTNEELQSPNEELQSQNEEFQSHNEESLCPEFEMIFENNDELTSQEISERNKIFSDAVETFKKVCESREERAKELSQREENEALYSFGKMISATIRSMNASKQAKAMQQVTDIVMRIKMEAQTEFNHIIQYVPQ